eukprot:IDg22734t1
MPSFSFFLLSIQFKLKFRDNLRRNYPSRALSNKFGKNRADIDSCRTRARGIRSEKTSRGSLLRRRTAAPWDVRLLEFLFNFSPTSFPCKHSQQPRKSRQCRRRRRLRAPLPTPSRRRHQAPVTARRYRRCRHYRRRAAEIDGGEGPRDELEAWDNPLARLMEESSDSGEEAAVAQQLTSGLFGVVPSEEEAVAMGRGGSVPGKAANAERSFDAAVLRICRDYFGIDGAPLLYSESDFFRGSACLV